MKTLVIMAHPQISTSRVNKIWKNELLKYKKDIKIYELYEEYPNWKIDVEKEQKQLEKYQNIIIQFPLYWYNYPPLLKKWFDDVFTHDWAYGSKGNKLLGKNIGLAISIGDKNSSYQKNGTVCFTVDALIAPFKATLNHVKANYIPYHAVFGSSFEASDESIHNNAKLYIKHIYDTRN